MKFAEASLDVIDDVDSNFVSPEFAVHLTNMKEQFLTTIALCSEKASPAKTAAAAATARVRKSHGPLFSSVIPASGVPQSPAHSPLTSSHVPSTPHRCTSRKGKWVLSSTYVTYVVYIAKSRGSDLKDHLSDVHHIGSPQVCNICKKKFKYKKGLKQHEKTSMKESLNIIVKKMTVTLVLIGSNCFKLIELDFMMSHHLKIPVKEV